MANNSVRLPLTEQVEPRLSGIDKDGLASNIFYDKDESSQYAVKRPGITSYIAGSGTASGTFNWNGLGFLFSSPSYDWRGVCWGNSTFCAVGNWDSYSSGRNALSAVSVTGRFWTTGTLPAEGHWFDVCWNGTVFCAIGYNPDESYAALCATSSDGITWTARTMATGRWQAIAADTATGRMVAVGSGADFSSPNVAYSTDNGVTWSSVTVTESGLAYGYTDVAWNASAGLFAMVGGGNGYKIATSPTGVTWTQQTVPDVNRRRIVASETRFVAFSYTSDATVYSDNGTSWTTGSFVGTVANYSCWTGNYFLVVSLGNNLYRSSDGITFERVGVSSYCYAGPVAGNSAGTSVCLSYTAFSGLYNDSGLAAYNLSLNNSASWEERNFTNSYVATNPTEY